MNTVEDLRAQAKLTREQRDEAGERQILVQIIGISDWKNEHFAEITDSN